MPARRKGPRVVKLHRNYTVAELAARMDVHRNTVRHWQSQGLEPIDGGRPVLFTGAAIRAFLTERQARRRSPCPPGTLYCVKCRQPRPPALGMVEYVGLNATGGNLKAICGECERIMHRRVTKAALAAIMPGIAIQPTEGRRRFNENSLPSPNCDLARKEPAR